jgi:hypothetical protein
MIMISITTSSYDLLGHLRLNPDASSELKRNRRRVNRTPTLDGGCSISDQGYSDADRTFHIRKNGISRADADRIWYIFRTYSLVYVSIDEGVFEAAIQDVDLTEGNLKAKILIKEKLT